MFWNSIVPPLPLVLSSPGPLRMSLGNARVFAALVDLFSLSIQTENVRTVFTKKLRRLHSTHGHEALTAKAARNESVLNCASVSAAAAVAAAPAAAAAAAASNAAAPSTIHLHMHALPANGSVLDPPNQCHWWPVGGCRLSTGRMSENTREN
jgi:hypothetical protein